MKKGIGLPVFPGVAIGPAVVYRKAQRTLPIPSGDPAVEKAKFNAALETAREQLTALFEKAKVEIGEEQAAIVEVQLLMLDDLDYLDGVAMAIEGGAAAAIDHHPVVLEHLRHGAQHQPGLHIDDQSVQMGNVQRVVQPQHDTGDKVDDDIHHQRREAVAGEDHAQCADGEENQKLQQ